MTNLEYLFIQAAIGAGRPLTESEFTNVIYEAAYPAIFLQNTRSSHSAYVDEVKAARNRLGSVRESEASPTAGEFISLGEYGFVRARDISMIRRLTSKSGEAFIEIRLADGALFDYPAGSTAETNLMNWLHAKRGNNENSN